jgi:signal transduction histidine kinase
MLEEVDRLAGLVDTLLRLSHADTGIVPLAPAPVDLHEVAREVVASLGILADDRHQRLAIVGAAPVTAMVDRVVLREAVINVVDNAIKYGPPRSSIDIRIAAEAGRAVMTIHDEGPGIPPEHRERIFDRFFRVDDARSRAAGGSGLGLAIAKWAVEVNGGRIRVDETVGRGTAIRIELPVSAGGAAGAT